MPSPPSQDPLDWQIVETRRVSDHGVFEVDCQRARHPGSGRSKEFSVIRCPDWVNVVAITPAQEVVFVRQYRPGVERVTLELPGGVVDPGESPATAARRELTEETGQEGSSWECLGCVEPNPALQNNRCWSFLALNCRRVSAPDPDEDEILEVVSIARDRVPELIRTGVITHSLVVSALHLVAIRSCQES